MFYYRFNGSIVSLELPDSVVWSVSMVLTLKFLNQHLGLRFGGLTNSMDQLSGTSLQSALQQDGLLAIMDPLNAVLGRILRSSGLV